MIGKILFKDIMGKNFNGLCPNKHGNVTYIKEKNKLSNRSIRPIYVALEHDNYFYYFRVQGKNNNVVYNSDYIQGMYLLINKNYFGCLPTKDSVLFLDNIYKINKINLYEIINQNHDYFMVIYMCY